MESKGSDSEVSYDDKSVCLSDEIHASFDGKNIILTQNYVDIHIDPKAMEALGIYHSKLLREGGEGKQDAGA